MSHGTRLCRERSRLCREWSQQPLERCASPSTNGEHAPIAQYELGAIRPTKFTDAVEPHDVRPMDPCEERGIERTLQCVERGADEMSLDVGEDSGVHVVRLDED